MNTLENIIDVINKKRQKIKYEIETNDFSKNGNEQLQLLGQLQAYQDICNIFSLMKNNDSLKMYTHLSDDEFKVTLYRHNEATDFVIKGNEQKITLSNLEKFINLIVEEVNK